MLTEAVLARSHVPRLRGGGSDLFFFSTYRIFYITYNDNVKRLLHDRLLTGIT